MLKQRIVTALILAPLAILALFFLPLEYFSGLMVAIVAIGAWEWGPLMGFATKRRRIAFAITNIAIITSLWLFIELEKIWLNHSSIAVIANWLLWLAILWWAMSAMLTALYPRYSALWAAHRSIRGVFGWLTLVPTWLAFVVIRSVDYDGNPIIGAKLLMFLFMMVWAADIGAYFVGKAIGKRKLLPAVSPGKTLEGFIGGVITAVTAVCIVGFIYNWSSTQFGLGIVLAIIISTVSVLGDLTESMFKRQAGIKDSGTILPGHGGILDRIDSLTATAPVFALCYVAYGW